MSFWDSDIKNIAEAVKEWIISPVDKNVWFKTLGIYFWGEQGMMNKKRNLKHFSMKYIYLISELY
jgi:hypothetical protein